MMTRSRMDSLEALIAHRLDCVAQRVDGKGMLNRIHRRLAMNRASDRARLVLRRVRWGMVAAAAIFLIVATGIPTSLSVAAATQLVSQTRQNLGESGSDRGYDLVHVPSFSLARDLTPTPQVPCHRLWTRGDRFWVEMQLGSTPWQWGRDEHGRVWLALQHNTGLRFGPNEIPQPLHDFMMWRQADLAGILRHFLVDFNLADVTSAAERHAGLRRLAMTPRQGRVVPHIRNATLDVDPWRREVQRITLRTSWFDQPLGTTTITLRERRFLNAESYHLEGHLDAGAEILDHQRPVRRLQILLRHFRQVLGAEWQKLEAAVPWAVP